MIGRKGILTLVSRFIIRLLEGIIYLVAVNQFLPIQFGYRQVATSNIGFFILLSILGFATIHIKIMAETENQNEAFTIFFLIKIILTVVSSIIFLIFIIFQIKNGLISNADEQLWIIVLIYFIGLLNSLGSIYRLSFQAKMYVARIELPLLLSTVIGGLFSLISVLVFHNFLLFLCGTIITSSIKLFFYIKFGKIFHFTKINFILLKRYITLSMIFLIPIILNTLIINLGPLIFLEYFNEELLGIYSVITGFIMLIKDIESNFHLLLIPNYVNLLSNDKYEQLNTSIKVFEKYMTILNGLIIIGGIIFAEFFITNFMGDIYYDKGRYLFYGTLLSLIIFPLLVPYLSLLITKEKLKFYSVIAFSNFIFSLISWIFFIPYFNIIGIELGSWIFLIPQILITRFYCVKNFGIEKLQNRDIKHLFFLFILIIFCFIITFSQIQFFFLIVIFIIITGVYIIFLFSTHILEKKDIYYLLEILNPKKMRSYIRNEINGQEKKNS